MSGYRDLRDALREPHDEPRARANWDAIARRRRPTPGVPSARLSWRTGLAGLAGLALAAAVVVVLGLGLRAPGPLALRSGAVMAGVIPREGATLDDGSRVTIQPGTRIEVLENGGSRVRFWLRHGVAYFDVTPGGPRRWSIDTGTVTVEVLGTSFSVARSEREVRVAVRRGTVLVRGPTAPDGMQRLHAGDVITIPIAPPPVASVGAPAFTPHGAHTDAPRDVVASAGAPSREPTRVAPQGSHEGIVVPQTGVPQSGSDIAPQTGSDVAVAPRMRDVDALRAAGRLDEAVSLLEAISTDTTAGRERALAAFTRGRLELDRRDHPHDAAAAFAQAIDLGLREPLREDATARRVESLSRAGDAAGARAAADDYARRYPGGRWHAEVARWSAER